MFLHHVISYVLLAHVHSGLTERTVSLNIQQFDIVFSTPYDYRISSPGRFSIEYIYLSGLISDDMIDYSLMLRDDNRDGGGGELSQFLRSGTHVRILKQSFYFSSVVYISLIRGESLFTISLCT